MKIETGRPWPMGARWDGAGVNVAVYSDHAEAVELCLFDDSGETRLRLPGRTDGTFHGYLRGAGPGLVYGLRAHGPWAPEAGHRFNPQKLLLDPYAREIVGRFEWRPEQFGHVRGHLGTPEPADNAAYALKARVVDADRYDWGDDRPPHIASADSVVYEMHVKGYSMRNPAVPAALRGTYAGLAHPASIGHLRRLGVSAVCLLPVHQRIDEERLVGMGLTNYWGYNTIGFFCPEPRLAAATEPKAIRDEFRAMVQALHAAGIEVILDVVYNHTAETDSDGPSIAWRGLDNATYYRLEAADRRVYENHAGTGNMLDIRQTPVLQLVMESLRWWVTEMRVDGFRFDLATVLGRGDHGFDRRGPFFTAVAQDPVLGGIKLIAEPWDIGPGGYQLGAFPRGWSEWNDRFRDTMRAFWLTGGPSRGAFAQRLCASAAEFQASGRPPAASLNYVISHDGFTLRDLVSYAGKHNEANGEANRDGTNDNFSVNGGVEGPSDDPAIQAARGRLQRALIAINLLAQGTPMLAAGDELGHTQRGNNNPYCQDNAITWIDWSSADEALTSFTARVVALRRAWQPFANAWYKPEPGPQNLAWFDTDGSALSDAAWNDAARRTLGCRIETAGRAAGPLVMLFNGEPHDTAFRLPAGGWLVHLDTSRSDGGDITPADGPHIDVAAHSLVLLSRPATA
jgi:glycogen operon protein